MRNSNHLSKEKQVLVKVINKNTTTPAEKEALEEILMYLYNQEENERSLCWLYRYISTLKAEAKIIGFQVVGTRGTDKEGQIHPDMSASWCLYNLKQARKMIDNRITENWSLLAIWTGDIEDAKCMFKIKDGIR
jgi:hypothetical protein